MIYRQVPNIALIIHCFQGGRKLIIFCPNEDSLIPPGKAFEKGDTHSLKLTQKNIAVTEKKNFTK